MKVGSNFLLFAVFVSGMSVLAVELSASRLLAPYFGSSLFIWTNIIGVVLAALSIGYYVGGRLADKYTSEHSFYSILLAGGLFIVALPYFTRPLLLLSIRGFQNISVGFFYSSLIGVLFLFAIPLFLLGMISPFAIRLRAEQVSTIGDTSGRIYALSTAGSILGAFLPVLVMIPFFGTAKTILFFGGLLLVVALIGLAQLRFALLPLLAIAILFFIGTSVKQTSGLVYETESAYNYIQVVEEHGVTILRLNEGIISSVYDPNNLAKDSYWHYFGVLPRLQTDTQHVLNIGLGAGSIAMEYLRHDPALHVDGVELDSKIVEVGRQYFGMTHPNLDVTVADGRTFLYTTPRVYDLIVVDAYRGYYIPFHLTTREFFQDAKARLNTEQGILALNLGAISEETELYGMITNTLASEFTYVYSVRIPTSLNYMLLASDHELNFDSLRLPQGDARADRVAKDVSLNAARIKYDLKKKVLTDDRAPVEIYTDKMILDYVTQYA